MLKRWACVLLALLTLGGCGWVDEISGGDETEICVRRSEDGIEFRVHKPSVDGGASLAENCPTDLYVDIDVYRDSVTLFDVDSDDYYIPEFQPLDGYIEDGDTFEFELDRFTLMGTLLENDDVLAVELDFDDGTVCEYELRRRN